MPPSQRPELTQEEYIAALQKALESAPEGLDETAFNRHMANAVEDAERKKQGPGGYADYGPLSQLMRDATLSPEERQQRLKESAPSLAASAVGAATAGAGLIPSAIAAGGAGYVGARATGQDEGQAALTAAQEGLAGPVAGGSMRLLGGLGKALRGYAPRMLQGGMKPVYEYVSRRAKAEGQPLAATAKNISNFIINQGLNKPEDAAKLVERMGRNIDAAAKTATEARRMAPVAAHIKQAWKEPLAEVEKNYLPGPPRKEMQNTIDEFLQDSPLTETIRPATVNVGPSHPPNVANFEQAAEDALREVMDAGPLNMTGHGPPPPPSLGRAPVPASQFAEGAGAPFRTSEPAARQIRAHVPPDELRRIIEHKSFFNKDAAMPGNEAILKGIETGSRNAFKEAVPEAVPFLKQQGRGMDAERLLDRATWREANRDVGGLAPMITAGVGAASGAPTRGALAATALGLLRNNQMRIAMQMGKQGPKMARSAADPINAEQLATAIRLLLGGNALEETPPPE